MKSFKELKDNMRDHFGKNLEEHDDRIVWNPGGRTYFKVFENGHVHGKMPLHSFETKEADSIQFKEQEIVVENEDTHYIFRK